MKQLGLAVLAIIAIAGLYALPPSPADPCPLERDWQCSGEFASLDDVPDFAAASESAVEAEGVPTLEVGFDELIIPRSKTDAEDVWTYELFNSTKWALDAAVLDTNTFNVAAVFESERLWEGAPRVLQPHPSRLQILDPRQKDVALDVELPERVDSIQWSDDGRLIVIDVDDTVAVFEPTDGE